MNQDIAAAAEFVGLRWFWLRERQEDLFQIPGIETWPALSAFQGLAFNYEIMKPKPKSRPMGWGFRGHAGVHQLASLDSGDWDPGGAFVSFQEHFRTALREAGAGKQFSLALAAALKEMASNAVEHANTPVAPVASFGVSEGTWCFGVTDLGRGVLSSLRDNRVYAAISSESDALRLVLQDGVSRTGKEGRGRGFTWVFKALVDRRARLRFRSSGASARWEGTSPTAQDVTYQGLPLSRRAGFHVRVTGPVR